MDKKPVIRNVFEMARVGRESGNQTKCGSRPTKYHAPTITPKERRMIDAVEIEAMGEELNRPMERRDDDEYEDVVG